MAFFNFESLESRRLLSTVTGAQIIAADRKELKYATAQLNADQQAQPALDAADSAAIAAARATVLQGSTVQKKFNSDKADAALEIAADQAAVTTAATSDLPQVTGMYKQIAADSGNAFALSMDNIWLGVDQAALITVVSKAVSKLQSDQTSTQKAIADDKAAIAALLQSTPAYTAAVARQEADGEIVPVDQAIAAAAGYRLQQDTNNYGLGAGSTGCAQ